MQRNLRLLMLLLILAATVGCDQATKHIARTRLGSWHVVRFPWGLGELRLAENSGSFLSFGNSFPRALRVAMLTIGVGIALLFMILYLVRTKDVGRLRFFGLALVCSGGVSNLIDRIARNGLVTDFMFLRAGPLHTGIFNVADVAIMAGLGLILCELWYARKEHKTREE